MNLLIVVDKLEFHGSTLNGPARYFSWITEHFDPARVRTTLCLLRGRGRADRLFRERGIDVVCLECSRFDPTTLIRLVRLVRERHIDLLHLNGYGATTFGRIAAALCGRPAVIQEHWVDHEMGALQGLIEKTLSLLPGRAIAISDYAKQFLIERKGIREERISVIRNGIPLASFRGLDPDAVPALRRRLGLPEDGPVVGIVGMLHENKGHRYFLEAAAQLCDRHPRAVFLVIGDGELRPLLEARARTLGLEGRVRFLGEQTEMPELLSLLDVYVLASISEAAGLSLLEAMAAGCAVVATDSGGPGEILRDGQRGLLVPVRDAGALAESIDALLRDPTERRRLGENARVASRAFDIEATVRKLQDFYEETLAASGHRPLPRVAANP